MNREKLIVLPLTTILLASCISIGYGVEIHASTINAGNSLTTTYITISLENDSEEWTFPFGNLTYNRDRVINNGVSDEYKSTTAESEIIRIIFDGHNVDMGTTVSKYVRLSESNLDEGNEIATFKLQFYKYESNTPVAYGNAITLSDADTNIDTNFDEPLELDETYGCQMIINVSQYTLSQAATGSVSFGVVFTAVANLDDS